MTAGDWARLMKHPPASTGRLMRYMARVGRATGHYGQIVDVLAWHGPRALVVFPDGVRAICPARCLRKLDNPALAGERK